jgi:hypothetical protein
MGDWIKENKSEAGLIFVTFLVAVVIYLFGSKKSGIYSEHKEFYDGAASAVTSLKGKKPFPNTDNVNDFEVALAADRVVVEALQTKLLAFRPEELKTITPSDFIDKLNAQRTELVGALDANQIEFPGEDFHMGFERYTSAPPRDGATGYLDYQLDALSALYNNLVKVGPSALVNVYRKQLPIETGPSMDAKAKADLPKTSGRRTRSRTRPSARAESAGPPFYRLPLELTFKSNEPAARRFIAAVTSDPKYYFVIRSLRIQNEKRDKAPKKDDVEFDKAPVTGAGGDEFSNSFETDLIPEDDPASESEGDPVPEAEELAPEPADDSEEEGERVLGQVLGAEEVFVFLQLDLILFKGQEDAKLP